MTPPLPCAACPQRAFHPETATETEARRILAPVPPVRTAGMGVVTGLDSAELRTRCRGWHDPDAVIAVALAAEAAISEAINKRRDARNG